MRVLLADANPHVRAALQLVVELADGQVVAQVNSFMGLMAQAARQQPEVIVLDGQLPGLLISPTHALADLINRLRLLSPGVQIVGLSSRPEARRDMLQAGADAFFCKSDPPESLIKLLESA